MNTDNENELGVKRSGIGASTQVGTASWNMNYGRVPNTREDIPK